MTKRNFQTAFGHDDSSSRPISVPNAPRLGPQTPEWDIPFLDLGQAACPEHLAVRKPVLQDSPSVLLLGQWEMRAKRP